MKWCLRSQQCLIFIFLSLLLVVSSQDDYDYDFGSGDEDTAIEDVKDDIPVVPDMFFDEKTKESPEESITENEASLFNKVLNRTSLLPEVTVLNDTQGTIPFLTSPSNPLHSAMTFGRDHSFAHFELKQFSMCPEYNIKLDFKSDKPNGLLVFLDQGTVSKDRAHHYVYLRHGRIAIKTIVGDKRNVFMSEAGGLQDRERHTLELAVSCSDGKITLTIDGVDEVFIDHSLHRIHHIHHFEHTANVWLGGVCPKAEIKPIHHFVQFTGCMKDVVLTPHQDSGVTVKNELKGVSNVESAAICTDHCLSDNPCPDGVRCINHFSHATCDCSKTGLLGKHCQKEDKSILTFKGDSYLTHKLYEFKDRTDRSTFRSSFYFKTKTPDSILLHIRNLYPHENSLSLIIDTNGRLRLGGTFNQLVENFQVEVDGVDQHMGQLLIDSRLEDLVEGKSSEDHANVSPVVTDDFWHSIHLTYKPKKPLYTGQDPDLYFGDFPEVNQVCHQPLIVGDSKCSNDQYADSLPYYFEATKGQCRQMEAFTGCGGNENQFQTEENCMESCEIKDLRAYKPFIGCMKKLYVNSDNLMDTLGDGRDLTKFTGHIEDSANTCDLEQKDILSLTTQLSEAVVPPTVQLPSTGFTLELLFKMKNYSAEGVIANGRLEMEDTISRWILYYGDNHVHIKLENGVLAQKSTKQVEQNGFNSIRLEATSSSFTLSLNDGSNRVPSDIPLSFISGVHLGDGEMAMIGCVKNVRVDGAFQDLRQFVNEAKGLNFDRCQMNTPCDKNSCLNGGHCHVSTLGESVCDCSGTDFEGNRCQFAKFKKSCVDYRRLGFNTSDHFLVDFDGAGKQAAVSVLCKFNEDSTVTELDHNIPENYLIRKKGLKDHTVAIKYHNLMETQLEEIVDTADFCSQDMSFQCVRAKLDLSTRTWFSSPKKQYHSNFGSISPAICPCRADRNCVRSNQVCNCDAGDSLKRVDSSTITDKEILPITDIHLKMNNEQLNKKSKATVTLGKLVCSTKTENWNTISLLDSSSYVEVPTKSFESQDFQSFGFAFRTSSKKALLFHKPSFHHSKPDLRILLTSATRLEFHFTSRLENSSIAFHTDYLLNTASWQHLWLDFTDSEIRLTLNGHKKFLTVETFQTQDYIGEFYLGGTPRDLHGALYAAPEIDGLIGCIKDLYVNDVVHSLTNLVAASPTLSYRIGCSLSCDPNPCQNGGYCFEKPMGAYECKCENPFAHFGENCETNLNDNAVTILGTSSELKYKNQVIIPTSDVFPLINDVTIAFKTRELQSQILFVIDNLQNLMQLSLSNTNEITLLWNTGYTLQELKLSTGKLKLNKGQVVQIYIERKESQTVLNVYTKGQMFTETADVGVQLIKPSEYQKYPFGSELPHPELANYQQLDVAATPFAKILMGGAVSDGVRSKLPGLRGCLSGLRVGRTDIPLDSRDIWSWNTPNLEIGCHSLCQDDTCHNGGTCQDVFHGDRMPTCECSRTSYSGRKCDQEIAFSFQGNDSVLILRPLRAFSATPLRVEISAALSEVKEETTQTLMVLRNIGKKSTPGATRFLAISLQGLDTLLVYHQSVQSVLYTADVKLINLADGSRFFVELTVDSEGVQLTVNHQVVPVLSSRASDTHLHSKDVALSVGGHENVGDSHVYWNEWKNFTGCISNLRLLTADSKVFEPLRAYSHDVEDNVSYGRIGLPSRTSSCSAFKVTTSVLVAHNVKEYQDAFRRMSDKSPKRAPIHSASREAEVEEPHSTLNTVGTISFIYLCLVCLAVAVYVYKISKKSKKDETDGLPKSAPEVRSLPTIVEETATPVKPVKVANTEPEATEKANLVNIEMKPVSATPFSPVHTAITVENGDKDLKSEGDMEKRDSLSKIADYIVADLKTEEEEEKNLEEDVVREEVVEPLCTVTIKPLLQTETPDNVVVEVDTEVESEKAVEGNEEVESKKASEENEEGQESPAAEIFDDESSKLDSPSDEKEESKW